MKQFLNIFLYVHIYLKAIKAKGNYVFLCKFTLNCCLYELTILQNLKQPFWHL